MGSDLTVLASLQLGHVILSHRLYAMMGLLGPAFLLGQASSLADISCIFTHPFYDGIPGGLGLGLVVRWSVKLERHSISATATNDASFEHD